jgi:hypothetical protein
MDIPDPLLYPFFLATPAFDASMAFRFEVTSAEPDGERR